MSMNLSQVNVSSSGTFNLDLQGATFNKIAWIEFLNESPYTLTTQIGGINVQVPAWYDYPIQLQAIGKSGYQAISGAQEPVNIAPMLIQENIISNISTVLLSTLYFLGETPSITTPQPLFRQGYVPNTVNNVSGASTSVINNGNPSGTNIVVGSPSGDPNDAVILTNDGNLTLGDATHPGSIDMPGGGATLGTVTAQDIVLTSQFTPVAGNVWSKLSFGNGTTGATGTVTVNHNLGVIPTSIVINGYNSINNSWGVITITTTQFTAAVSSGNAKTFAWIAIS